MKNKIPFLVLVCCLFFCIPCYADDVEIESDISMNDVIVESDISANEYFIDNNEVDLFSSPLMSIENNSDVIDYSDKLDNIYNLLSSFLKFSSDEIFEYSYSDSTFIDYTFSINNGSLYANDEDIIETLYGYYIIDRFDIVSSTSGFTNFTIYYYDDGVLYSDFGSISHPNGIISNIDITVYSANRSYDNIIQPSAINDVIETVNALKYLILFLVLERVLYIGWDLFSKIGGSRNE